MKGLLIKDRHLITKNGIGALAITIVFVAFMKGSLGMKNQFWLPLASPSWLNWIDPLVCFAFLSVFVGAGCFVFYAIVCRHYEKMDF